MKIQINTFSQTPIQWKTLVGKRAIVVFNIEPIKKQCLNEGKIYQKALPTNKHGLVIK